MIRSKNILFRLGYISHTHYPAFRYPFMNAMRYSGRHESLWHAAACVTRTLHFSAHGRARALSYLKAHLKAHTRYVDRNREKRRVEGLTDAVIHMADASAITSVHSKTISRQFVTMPIKVDTLERNLPPLACRGRLPKMESDTSERYLAIYDIDDRKPRDRDNVFTISMNVGRLNLHHRNYYPDISSGSNSIRIRRSKYTNSSNVQTFRRFFTIFEPCVRLFTRKLVTTGYYDHLSHGKLILKCACF